MTGTFEELDQIANSLEEFAERGRHQDLQGPLKDLWDAAEQVGRCSSGSWIGYHANVYYQDLRPPPPGVHFSSEWGPTGVFVPERTIGNWVEYDPSKVTRVIYEHAQNPDVGPANTYTEKGARAFQAQKQQYLVKHGNHHRKHGVNNLFTTTGRNRAALVTDPSRANSVH